jgi:hypothetical protein
VKPGRARGRLPRGRAPGTAPRGRRRTIAFDLAAAGTYVSAAAFAFCVIASVAFGWHRAVTKPGIAVSVIVLIACVLVLNLTAGDE